VDFVDLAALPHARAIAGAILGLAGARAPLELLLALIDDEEAEVAEGALRSLAAYPDSLTPGLAAHLLERIPSLLAGARETLLLTLARACTPVTIAALFGYLADDQHYWGLTMTVLEEEGSAFPAEQLLPWLDAPDYRARAAAITALGERVAVERLLPFLTDTEGWGQAENPLRAVLENLVQRDEPIPWEPLLPCLHDHDSYVVHLAAFVLWRQGERVPVAVLLDALEATEDYFLPGLLLGALAQRAAEVPRERIAQALLGKARFSDWSFMLRSGKRLPLTFDLRALAAALPRDALTQGLLQGDVLRRAHLLGFVGYLGAAAPMDALVAVIETESGYLRQLALEAVMRLGPVVPKTALSVIRPLVYDPDRTTRRVAAAALGTQGEHIEDAFWLELCAHSDSGLRRQAISELGRRGRLDPRLSALADQSSAVRETAVATLAALGEQLPLEPLDLALRGPSEWQRGGALEVANRLGEAVPIALLRAGLQHIEAALERLASDASVPAALIELCASRWRWPFRVALLRRECDPVVLGAYLREVANWEEWSRRRAVIELLRFPGVLDLLLPQALALLREGPAEAEP
jgi:HEAT repeat protein